MRIAQLLVLIGAACAAAPGTRPRIVVDGTGDPNLDITAVQAAVDHGGEVLLQGHFSFDKPPARSAPPQAFFPRMASVLVSKEVVIAGAHDLRGEMTSIDGGTWPFAVEALGSHVTIQGLRFVRPKGGAIEVNAVSGLEIADCRVDGVEPIPSGDMAGARVGIGIGISTTRKPPTPAQHGKPEDVSGSISILNNYIDAAGGTVNDMTVGILIFSVGRLPGREVDLFVSGNHISNVTERAVNIRQLGGRAYIERNVISTGSIVGGTSGVAPDAIHVFGAGSYLVAHNSIQSGWAAGAGIRVHAAFAEWPIIGAMVLDNDVNMVAPASAVFGTNSAAIEIRGFAQGNVVINNRIRGRARAALAVVTRDTGIPGNSQFVSNDLEGFQPSSPGVSVQDAGRGTVIVKLGGKDK